MEQPVVSAATSKDSGTTSKRDLLAMLAMLDYLIVHIKPVDEVSAHCLVLAHRSLENTATRGVGSTH
jgi:hypothetical protein